MGVSRLLFPPPGNTNLIFKCKTSHEFILVFPIQIHDDADIFSILHLYLSPTLSILIPISIFYWNKSEGGRAQSLKEWHRTYKNWLELTRSKVAEESSSSTPWASLYAHYNTLAYAKWHTPQHHDWYQTNHSLAHEITEPIKNYHAIFQGFLLPSEMAYSLSLECVSP